MPNLTTTAVKLQGGVAPIAERLEKDTVTFTGTWALGDYFAVILTNEGNGVQYTVGYGDITGKVPTYCFTYGNRMYLLVDSSFYFSALQEPEVFNDPNGVGNGFVTTSNFYGAPEDLVSVGHYQGKLAFLSQQTIQIWQPNADPTLFSLSQVLPNIGTFARNSTQSIGDLDLLFLHTTGIRSLRARETSLSAFVVDIGSPIDDLIKTKLAECTDDEKANAVSVIESSTNSYWLFIKDKIYVLSYYPTAKIIAWSTFDATYDDGGQQEFVPTVMEAHNGQVYIRGDDDALYVYGGEDGLTYDDVVASVEIPWLDNGKPATSKNGSAVDVGILGHWKVKAGMDYFDGTLSDVMNVQKSTFGYARIPYTARGTHFKLRMESQGTGEAKLSSILFHFIEEGTKG